MIVTFHLLRIQYSIKEIFTYRFLYIIYFGGYYGNHIYPRTLQVRYAYDLHKLNKILLVQNKFSLCPGFFLLINGQSFLVQTLPRTLIYTNFIWSFYGYFLNSCAVLIFPSQGNLVSHLIPFLRRLNIPFRSINLLLYYQYILRRLLTHSFIVVSFKNYI